MISWLRQLEAATTLDEVVAIARDYLATWTPEELARLPRACRPGRLRKPEDIEELHICSVDAYRVTRASGEELTALQLLTSFIVRASQRIAQLRGASEVERAVSETNPGLKRPRLGDR
jgi:hypothetical protein